MEKQQTFKCLAYIRAFPQSSTALFENIKEAKLSLFRVLQNNEYFHSVYDKGVF